MNLAFRICCFVFSITAATLQASSTIHKPWGLGKDFYLAFPRPGWGSLVPGASVVSPTVQRLTITTPASKPGVSVINYPNTVQYLGGIFHCETTPDKIDISGATHIQGEQDFSVIGEMGTNATKGTFLALPVTSWGTEYYVVDVPENVSDNTKSFFAVPGITIIAAQNGTSVSITPTATTAGGHLAGTVYNVSLNAGDVYYITTAADPNGDFHYVENNPCEADFSGTSIISNVPIGVLVSASYASWPCGDESFGDYGIEWLPPVNQWDTEYVFVPSAPRQGGITSDVIRMLFRDDNTKLYIDDGSGPQLYGTFGANQISDYVRSFTGMHILADHPFFAMNITTKPAEASAGGSYEAWNFSMAMQIGRHQWTDFAAFTGIQNSSAILDLIFLYSDRSNILVGGIPLSDISPIIPQLPGGFARIRTNVNTLLTNGGATIVRGLNGATFTGNVFGFGNGIYGVGGIQQQSPQSPDAINSYGHPIIASSVSLSSVDTVPPHISISFGNCGSWNVTAFDDEQNPPSSGLADVSLVQIDSSDTSYNLAFHSPPTFKYGDISTPCNIDIINLAQPAQASLRVRDMAGNEFDTIVAYTPQRVDALPAQLSFGAVRSGTNATGSITLSNRSDQPLVSSAYRLRYGASHHWSIVAPIITAPFTIAAHDSIVFHFEYSAPSSQTLECDDDSLMITTCREFAIAAVHACNKRPAIQSTDAAYECEKIDSLGDHGDTSFVPRISVVNTGNDTLHVVSLNLVGISPDDVVANPATDFTIDPTLTLPTQSAPWIIVPNDTIYIAVQSHPHHTGARVAGLVIASDAGTTADTALLTGCGITPDINGIAQHTNAAPDALALIAYPNPFGSASTPTATLSFSLAQQEHVTIELCTMLGETIATVLSETRSAGEQHVTIDATNLRNGIYFYKVVYGAQTMMHTIVVEK